MRKKYSIGFIIVLLIVLVFVSGAFTFSYDMARDKAREEKIEAFEKKNESHSVETDGEAAKVDYFYLCEEHGYITVYLSDKKTVFEYTSIDINDLPSDLMKEIKNGKYMEDIEELYSFLESYSS